MSFHDKLNASRGEIKDDLFVTSCGTCYLCRATKARGWIYRFYYETLNSPPQIALNLTYDKFNNTGQLHSRDLQLFNKLLRKKTSYRFFGCGEYGEQFTRRPHYHLVYFGLKDIELFHDWKLFCTNGKNYKVYRSENLENIWKKGFVFCQSIDNNADLVAKYVSLYFTSNSSIKSSLFDNALIDDPVVRKNVLSQYRSLRERMYYSRSFGWKGFIDSIDNVIQFPNLILDNVEYTIPKSWLEKLFHLDYELCPLCEKGKLCLNCYKKKKTLKEFAYDYYQKLMQDINAYSFHENISRKMLTYEIKKNQIIEKNRENLSKLLNFSF